MRGFLLVCGLAAVASGFGACGGSAFTAGAGDDGGASGSGSGSGSGGDDGSGSGSGSGGDASSGSSSSSGGVDAGGRWCASEPQHSYTFCEDFDGQGDVNAFLSTWSNFEQNSGQFKFDHASVPSPPNALQAVGVTNATVLAIKSFQIPSRPKTVRLEFALRINSAGAVSILSAAGFAAIAYGTGIGDGYAAMAIGNGPDITAAWAAPGDAGAGDAGTFQTANAQGSFPTTGQWAGRFAIEIDYGNASTGTSGACAQIFQGPTPLLKNCLQLPPSLGDPHVLSVVVGDLAAGLGATGAVDLEFDDLTFNVAY